MQKFWLFTGLLYAGFLALTPAQAGSLYSADAIDRVINLEQTLPADYVPTDLVRAVDFGIIVKKDADLAEMQLRLAQDADSHDPKANLPSRLRELMYACEQQTGEVSQLGSGYRSYEKQAVIHWNRHGMATAAPGTSEHQAGLAADLAVGGQFLTENSATYSCLKSEGWKYGFILSYPRDNRYLGEGSLFEPWHWRYVGLETARLLYVYQRQNYPQEFLSKLNYFQFLAAHGLAEDISSLRRVYELIAAKRDSADRSEQAEAVRLTNFAGLLSSKVLAAPTTAAAEPTRETVHAVAPALTRSAAATVEPKAAAAAKPTTVQRPHAAPRRFAADFAGI